MPNEHSIILLARVGLYPDRWIAGGFRHVAGVVGEVAHRGMNEIQTAVTVAEPPPPATCVIRSVFVNSIQIAIKLITTVHVDKQSDRWLRGRAIRNLTAIIQAYWSRMLFRA